MDFDTADQNPTVLILKADRLYADLLRVETLRGFPRAQITVASSVAEATAILGTEPADLLVTGLSATLGGDVLELIARCRSRNLRARRILVVTARYEYRVLATLRSLAVDGVFDCLHEPPAEFSVALQRIVLGGRFWSRSVMDYMRQTAATSTALFRLLTVFEEVVLSVIGDGCDDSVAARELGLSPSTISTVRRELHRKLGVQHRGELVRAAAQHGFVRFTPSGVIRPGFAILQAAYQARRPKRDDPEPFAFRRA